MAECHSAARLPALPRPACRDGVVTHRSSNRDQLGGPDGFGPVVIHAHWFGRPDGESITLRKPPRVASWNTASDLDQVRLREYLDDTVELLARATTERPWTLMLEVGLPAGRDRLDMPDLDNYALPLAARLRNEHLVSVWCTKRIGDTSRVSVVPAKEVAPPQAMLTLRTTASSDTKAYKEQVRAAAADAPELPEGGVILQIAFVVGPLRNWLNLWKPTIDALDPLLGRTHVDRDWHPKDGRITDLGLHLAVDPSLGHDVVMAISADPVVST